jgi:DNA primase
MNPTETYLESVGFADSRQLLQDEATSDVAAMSVAEEFAKLSARRGARREIEDAMRDLEGLVDEGLTWRLGQAAEALNNAGRSEDDDTAEYDIGPNGARMKRDEKSAFDDLIGRIMSDKGKSGSA